MFNLAKSIIKQVTPVKAYCPEKQVKSIDAKEIKSIECRFAVYCKSEDGAHDMHLVKEQIHYKDGTTEPNVKLVQDYARPFYITKKGKQNHTDFKEWELKDNLDTFKSTQTKLTESVAKALGQSWFKGGLRDLCKTPYVYGVDVLSTSLIKQSYAERWDVFTPYTVAAFDTETDVIHGHGQIMLACISFKTKVFIAVQKSFVAGYSNVEARVQELMKKYLGKEMQERKIVFELAIVNTEIDVIKATIAKAHEWAPDFLTVWNILFDMDKIIAACDRAQVPIEDILSDPKVPKEFRSFRFKKGPAKKVMASGRILNFKPAERWNTVFCPSSFYWIDGMCAYKQIRTGEPAEPSYGLDAILKKNKIGGKLEFAQADHLADNKLDWHKFMQANHPLEYIVYNAYDCISMEILDEKTTDLQIALPRFAGHTDFQNFNSQPRKAMNELHFFVDKMSRVPGATASEMSTDNDELTADNKGWIVMLASHLVADNGLCVIEENPELRTNIRGAVADLDIEGAYPHNELVMNVSRETTSKELIKVKGIPDEVVRKQSLNLSGGRTNAVEFSTTMYGLPVLDVFLEEYLRSKTPQVENQAITQ